jgi:predicted DNA-binding transcriptional regulator YafY
VSGRAKALNETVYYNIDAIHAAINAGKKIRFKYFDYTTGKNRVYRRNGSAYVRTPIAMCWNDDKYYLIAYNKKYEDQNPFANFRVDRMSDVVVCEEKAEKYDKRSFNVNDYVKRSFGMYVGETVRARLAFDESLVNPVLDHFGHGTALVKMKDGSGRFSILADVSSSPVFLSWMLTFGDKAEILEPDSLRAEMRKHVAAVGKLY